MDIAASATRVLVEVIGSRRPLPQALSRAQQREKKCKQGRASSRERALLQAICYGVMRWLPRLELILAQLTRRPAQKLDLEVACLLLTGLYRLEYMRSPAYKVVNLTVEGCNAIHKPWTRGLVNATLRRYLHEREQLLLHLQEVASARYAHPAWLIEVLRNAWPENWEQILEAANQHPPMHLRVNRLRNSREEYQARLQQCGIEAQPALHCQQALTLEQATQVARLPGFDQGLVSVQDSAAQLCPSLLDLRPGLQVLDACAAPGGKSTHILETEPALKRMVCLEPAAPRVALLKENLERLGLKAEVIQTDLRAWCSRQGDFRFDRILLDVPCSATGVIRRQPDIKNSRSKADLAELPRLQSELLDAAWTLLRPEGKLLYASCSILPEENEAQIESFLQRQPGAKGLPLQAPWGQSTGYGRQILPGESDMDGFYYAALQRI